MASHLDDPAFWRLRAAELRAIAENLADYASREQLIACAMDYGVLAERAEEPTKSAGRWSADLSSRGAGLLRFNVTRSARKNEKPG